MMRNKIENEVSLLKKIAWSMKMQPRVLQHIQRTRKGQQVREQNGRQEKADELTREPAHLFLILR